MGSSSGADDGATAAIRWERVCKAPPLSRWHTAGRVVLLGDAAHAMPINLAQGAAAAIEGAFLLGRALDRHADTQSWEAAFEEYEATHRPRVRQCRIVTSFTEALAAPATAPTEALRNAMRIVPQPLNSAIFDAALLLSLGDVPAATRRRWPLDVGPPV